MECYKKRIDAIFNGFKVEEVKVELGQPIKAKLESYYMVSYKTVNNGGFYDDFNKLKTAKKISCIKENI